MAFDIILLGTGSPLPAPNRCGNGNLVVSGNTTIMIDCGWGSARKAATSGVPLASIDTLFFTHMHSDHITDLPDLLMLRWTVGAATHPLTIYGPEGTREMAEGFRTGLNADVRYRIAHHGDKLPPEGISLIIHEIPATDDVTFVATVGDLKIGAFEVQHPPVVPALGFKVEQGDVAAVFSGDTLKCDALINAAKGADVLVSEAVHIKMMNDRIEFARRANNERGALMLEEACNYHTPTTEVAEMARDAGVGALVLSHLLPSIPDDGPMSEQFVAGMSAIYNGPITIGRDLYRFRVGTGD